MTIAYLPGWTFVDLGPDGGPYDETAHPKACVHTTEGGSLAGAEAAYAAYPPHLGYDPRTRTKHQYVRLDRHSYAFKGSESDDEFIIQVEVVGRAAETHTWPDEWYRNFAEDVIRPLREHLGIPDQHLRYYRADEGIVLARATSPIRLTDAQLRAFSGWLGHQHIPAPDEHWDPGGFLMGKALDYAKEDTVSWTDRFKAPNGKEYSAAEYLVWTNWYVGQLTAQVAGLQTAVDKLAGAVAGDDLTAEELKAAVKAGTTEAIAEGLVKVDVTVSGAQA